MNPKWKRYYGDNKYIVPNKNRYTSIKNSVEQEGDGGQRVRLSE